METDSPEPQRQGRSGRGTAGLLLVRGAALGHVAGMTGLEGELLAPKPSPR